MRYDNCKACVAKCEHAGKDRKFVIPTGRETCKVTRRALEPGELRPCPFCGEENMKIVPVYDGTSTPMFRVEHPG